MNQCAIVLIVVCNVLFVSGKCGNIRKFFVGFVRKMQVFPSSNRNIKIRVFLRENSFTSKRNDQFNQLIIFFLTFIRDTIV